MFSEALLLSVKMLLMMAPGQFEAKLMNMSRLLSDVFFFS